MFQIREPLQETIISLVEFGANPVFLLILQIVISLTLGFFLGEMLPGWSFGALFGFLLTTYLVSSFIQRRIKAQSHNQQK